MADLILKLFYGIFAGFCCLFIVIDFIIEATMWMMGLIVALIIVLIFRGIPAIFSWLRNLGSNKS
ncbi:MAG: hypothetical protein ABIK92_06560 [Pseudomonadota bacterium]